jgi:hypothetical protein
MLIEQQIAKRRDRAAAAPLKILKRPAGAPANHIDQALASLFTRDSKTNRPTLTIPLPETVTQGRLAGALAALLGTLGKNAAGPGH